MTPQDKAKSDQALLDLNQLHTLTGCLARMAQTLRSAGLAWEYHQDEDPHVAVRYVARRPGREVEIGVATLLPGYEIPDDGNYYLFLGCIEENGEKVRVHWSWTSSMGLTWEAPEEANVAIKTLDQRQLNEAVQYFWRST